MSATLLAAIGCVVTNGLFALLLWRIRRIRGPWLRSAVREGLFWATMLLQLLAAARGIGVLENDGTWFGRADDIGCALGGLWLGLLALGERRARRPLVPSAAAPGGRQC